MSSTVKIIEVIGSSEKSWEDAAKNAIKDASKTIRNVLEVDVINQTAKIENNEIVKFRTTLKLAFVVES